jgi:hypothetical protein
MISPLVQNIYVQQLMSFLPGNMPSPAVKYDRNGDVVLDWDDLLPSGFVIRIHPDGSYFFAVATGSINALSGVGEVTRVPPLLLLEICEILFPPDIPQKKINPQQQGKSILYQLSESSPSLNIGSKMR